LGIDTIEFAHTLGEIAVGRLHQQVVVVSHLTVGVDDPIETLADLPQYLEPHFPILIEDVDSLAPAAA
jgi:hypothetical protein